MSDSRAFDRILAALHAAALDYAGWSAASGLIDEALGTHGNSMIFADGDTDEDIRVFFAWAIYRGKQHPEIQRYYFENFYSTDERPPRVRRAPDGRLIHMTEIYTAAELKTSAAYNALRSRGHAGNGINVRLDGPNGSRITWVVHDPLDGGSWSSAQLDVIRGLLPHIRHTVRVQQSLAGGGALGATLSELLECTGLGIIQLDARGRILSANDPARDLLRTGSPLFDEGGFLFASTPQDNDNFQRLLGCALPASGVKAAGRLRHGGSMTLKRVGPRPPLMLHANPVGQGENDLGLWPVAALVFVVDPAGSVSVDPAVAAETLGLTEMEGEVAALMAQNISVPHIATAMGRKVSTIRSHVKSMYAKHGITRQTELVRLVQSLSGVPGVTRR